jgi:bacterioferritin
VLRIEEFQVFVDGDLPVAEYKETRSDALAEKVAKQVGERRAVLIANHGLLTRGMNPQHVIKSAALVERTAEIVWGTRQLRTNTSYAAVDGHLRGLCTSPMGRRHAGHSRPVDWVLFPRMEKNKLIESLNEDLELEYRSLVQYVLHIATVKGAEYQSILDELGVHVRQELDHALVLARQIDFLGGTPTTRVPDVPPESDARTALRQDLQLEEGQLQRYRDRVEQATAAGLPDVAESLAPLLQQTQEHVRDLRSALGG